MKKIFLITAILACITLFANAQTTMEDYHYVTTGFKDDMYKMLGFRPGYSLEKIGSKVELTTGGITKGAHLFTFKINNITKAYMVKLWDSESNRAYYCIPSSDSDPEVLTLALKTLTESNRDTKELIERLLIIKNCEQIK
ncbi:MAG: hypothetical protein ACKVOM_02575 [Ferruginibacter sp.]